MGTIGLFALLFLTGLECELDELMAVGLQAGGVALTGVLLPLTLGTFGLLWSFHVPLIAAVLDDILGIVLLAVVVSLAGSGSVSLQPILRLVLAAVAFVAVSLLLSRRAAPLFDAVLDRLQAPGDVVVAAFLVL